MSGHLIHLLRHGPPQRTGLLLGHTDEPALDDACPELFARAEALALRRIIASDLTRARVPAAILAGRLGIPFAADPRWRELDFGAWDGLAPEAVDPGAFAAFWHDPEAHPPPEGERWSALKARVARALDALEPDTLVVTHAGAMRAALAVLTGLDHRMVWAFDLPYRARLSLRVWPGDVPTGQVVGLDTGVCA